ncbi:hypothetical protein Tco_0423664, partial [Tanacetum coccineum]
MTDDAGTTKATVGPNLVQEMISMGPTIRKRRRQRDAGEGEHNACRGKSLAGMSVDPGLALHAQKTQEPPIATQTV